MSTLEIILSIVSVVFGSGNILQFVSLRAIQKKTNAEATGASDGVLYKRVEWLDRRITLLEQSACFRSDCVQRISVDHPKFNTNSIDKD